MIELKTVFQKMFANVIMPLVLLLANPARGYCQQAAGQPVNADTFSVDPAKAQVLRCSTGFYIEIPANAFVDENATTVKGKVELVFKDLSREDGDKASTDKSINLGETAFRLRAYARGERVDLAAGRHLNVFYQAWSERERNAYEYNKGWQPLRNNKVPRQHPKPIATVQFLFKDDSDKCLKPFTTIKWQIANTGGDTTGCARQPYLNTKWTSLNLSKPKYGMREMKEPPIFGWNGQDNVFSQRGNPLFGYKHLDTLVLGNEVTGKSFRIEHLKKKDYWINIDDESPNRLELVKFLGDRFVFVNTLTAAGYYWYDVDGRQILNLKNRRIDEVLMDTVWNRLAMVERVDGRHRNVELFDFKGRHINTFKIELSKALNNKPLEIEYNKSGILLINTGGSIVAYDTVGHPLLFLNGVYRSFRQLVNDKVLCINENYEPTIMDMRDKKGEVFQVDKKYGALEYLIPQGQNDQIRYLLMLNQKDSLWQSVLLDCDRLQFHDLSGFYSRKCFVGTMDSAQEYIEMSLELMPWVEYNPGLLLGLSFDGKTIQVYSVACNRIIYTFPFRQPKWDPGYPMDFVKGNPRFIAGRLSGDRYLVLLWEQIMLIDTNGRLLRDFTAQDSAISLCMRIDSNSICAISDSGLLTYYNLNGELIPDKSSVFEKNNCLFYLHSAFEEGKISRVDRPYGEKIYNATGNYLYHSGGRDIIFEDTDIVLVAYASRPINQFKYSMYKIVPLPPDVWQLELRTDSDLFIEYVYPDPETLKKWEVYKKQNAFVTDDGTNYFYDNRIYKNLQIDRLAKYKIAD